jgi:ribosome-associated protein YbcJ (S4-like RNA binding protein)
MAQLVLSYNNTLLGRYPLRGEPLRIGRSRDNDIRITQDTASGHHAQVVLASNGAFIKDLGSTNGTFLNGRMIRHSRLEDGDVISVGKHELRYLESDDGPEDAAPPPPEAQPEDASDAPRPTPLVGRLRFMNGPSRDRILDLKGRVTAIGRAGDPIVAVASGRKRCFVVRLGEEAALSRVAVNGRPVGRRARKLHAGDVIEVGEVRMEFLAAS